MNRAFTCWAVSFLVLACLGAGVAGGGDANEGKSYSLLPRPRQVVYGAGFFKPLAGKYIYIDAARPQQLLSIAFIVQESCAQIGPTMEITAAGGAEANDVGASITIDANAVGQREGYRLTIEPNRISIVAGGSAGAFYAAQTLKQICRQSAGPVRCVKIDDRPDFAARGVMLDVSRDKVPKMETVFQLVDMLAEWKINQFQLYTEHTFAYRRGRTVWQDASPFTGQEILQLDGYCRQRFVELVPNQNSFGHMHRWLRHERYRHLAESPTSSTLCPTDPCSIKFIEGLYDELLPHFSSRLFNVGCDETIDIGQGRSKEAVERIGQGGVYLDFLLKIHDLAARRGRTMQFWGDIVLMHPELIDKLPRDVIALDWGYEAGHPFGEQCRKFAEAGVGFYVCPGTSGWNSIAGRTDNAIANIRSAAEAGLANGAAGLLNTDWGDFGHWQPQPVSWPGYAYGAAVSWSVEANRDINLPAALDLYAFKDSAGITGRVVYDLGNAYKVTGVERHNGTVLFSILQSPAGPVTEPPWKGLTAENLTKTIEYIDGTMERLAAARIQRPDGPRIKGQLICAANMLRHACRFGIARLQTADGRIAGIPQAKREELAAELEQIIAHFKGAWLNFNRPGGLTDSVAPLESLLGLYRGGEYNSYPPKH